MGMPYKKEEYTQGVCWACVEYEDDWTPKTIVAYCMAGDQCQKHEETDGIEQITDPFVIDALDILINPNENRMN